MKKYILLILLLIIPFNAYSDSANISETKRKDIRKLLEITEAKKITDEFVALYIDYFTAALQSTNEEIPDVYYNIIREEIPSVISKNMDSILDSLVPVYARNFTDEDIKGLIKFYQTPLGQKLIKKQSIIMKDAMVISAGWATGLEQQLIERIDQRVQEELNK